MTFVLVILGVFQILTLLYQEITLYLEGVGACIPTMRECDDECLTNATVYVDSRESAENESGDIILSKVWFFTSVSWSDVIILRVSAGKCVCRDRGDPIRGKASTKWTSHIFQISWYADQLCPTQSI